MHFQWARHWLWYFIAFDVVFDIQWRQKNIFSMGTVFHMCSGQYLIFFLICCLCPAFPLRKCPKDLNKMNTTLLKVSYPMKKCSEPLCFCMAMIVCCMPPFCSSNPNISMEYWVMHILCLCKVFDHILHYFFLFNNYHVHYKEYQCHLCNLIHYY